MNHGTNYLGLDYGTRKIGVALAHAETRLAMAYGVLHNDEKLLENIGALLTKEEVGTVVIGIPTRNARHSELNKRQNHEYVNESAEEKFGKKITERFKVAVEYQDEMFTSKMAQHNLIAQGEKRVSAHDDAEAASILLQSWLDQR